jgi:hypothetical protein
VTVEGRAGPAAENAEGEGDALAAAALRAVYGFVTHFFGCAHCREHFLAAHPPAEVEWPSATLSFYTAIDCHCLPLLEQ